MAVLLRAKIQISTTNLKAKRTLCAIELIAMDIECEPRLSKSPANNMISWNEFRRTLGREFLPEALKGEEEDNEAKRRYFTGL